MQIQAELTQRCIELLNLPEGESCYLLDVGFVFCLVLVFLLLSCGSGLSGEELSDQGHVWVGMDISKDMIGIWLCSFMKFSSLYAL